MCGSQGNNCCCCPDAMIFTEKICGDFGSINQVVWSAPEVNDYIQGTFEVFNAGSGRVDFSVNFPTNPIVIENVPPGTSQSISVNNPETFIIQTIFNGVYSGTTGKWCITLYKRVFA